MLTKKEYLLHLLYTQLYGSKNAWGGMWKRCEECNELFSFGSNWSRCKTEADIPKLCPYCQVGEMIEPGMFAILGEKVEDG